MQDVAQNLAMIRSIKRQWQRVYTNMTLKAAIIVSIVTFLYIVLLILYIHFVAYSRHNLMGHTDRLCNKCQKSPIPKILHNTWIDKNVPEKWHETWHSCLEKHKDYEQKLWTHDDMDAFIEKEYSWFFPLYKSYPYQIQRAASFRYFIMYHFGGVYIDLDIGCKESVSNIMANLSDYNVLLAETKPCGITNAFQASIPKHSLYRLALTRLRCTSWWHGIPYIHVIFATGPMFFTGTLSLNDNHDVYIMPYHTFRDRYFWLIKGLSWQKHWDSAFFLLMDRLPFEFWNVFTFLGVMLIILAIASCMMMSQRYRSELTSYYIYKRPLGALFRR